MEGDIGGAGGGKLLEEAVVGLWVESMEMESAGEIDGKAMDCSSLGGSCVIGVLLPPGYIVTSSQNSSNNFDFNEANLGQASNSSAVRSSTFLSTLGE